MINPSWLTGDLDRKVQAFAGHAGTQLIVRPGSPLRGRTRRSIRRAIGRRLIVSGEWLVSGISDRRSQLAPRGCL